VDQQGNVSEVSNSDARMIDLHALQMSLQSMSVQGPTGVGPGGSSAPTFFFFDAPVLPINFVPLDNHGTPAPQTIPNNSTILQGTPAIFIIQQTTPPALTITINDIAIAPSAPPGVTLAGKDVINGNLAKAGFAITGSTTGVDNGQTVTVKIIDSNG